MNIESRVRKLEQLGNDPQTKVIVGTESEIRRISESQQHDSDGDLTIFVIDSFQEKEAI